MDPPETIGKWQNEMEGDEFQEKITKPAYKGDPFPLDFYPRKVSEI